MSTPAIDTERYRAIVGTEHAREIPHDSSTATVGAVVSVHPATTDEVAAVVVAARGAGHTLTPYGLGGHLDCVEWVSSPDVLVSLDRMSAIVDHQPADMTVQVQTGCPLRALGDALGECGQWLPLDPVDLDATTVGGLLAARLSGPLRASQGTPRDYVIGIETVSADGEIVRGGGRVVKNVAGYDLAKAHIGAFGTLGIITSVTLKVRPRPDEECAVTIEAESHRAVDLALAARDLADPLWLELEPGAGGQIRIQVGLAGLPTENAPRARRIEELARSHDAVFVGTVTDAAAERTRIGALAGAPIVLRASTLPTDLAGIVETLDAAEPRLAWHAHAAAGILRIGAPDAAVASISIERLRPDIERRGGTLIVERASRRDREAIRASHDPSGRADPAVSLMRRLRETFDSSGRFGSIAVGGGA